MDSLKVPAVATSQDSIISMVSSALQSVGMELLIFVVTVIVALVFRRLNVSVKRNIAAKVSKNTDWDYPAKAAETQVQKRQSAHQHQYQQNQNQQPLKQATSEWGELQRVVQGFAEAGSRPRSPQTTVHKEELIRMFNEIIECMRDQPGLKSANRAVDIYADLRRALRSDSSLRMLDLVRCTRYSALDLYTTVVHCAIRTTQVHLVDCIVADMTQEGIARPIMFYESAMKQLAKQKHYHLALGMYDRMVADGLEPSGVTLSCLINFAAELGELNRAIAFFEQLCRITTPSIRACMTVLRVHSKRHDWQAAVSTLNVMKSRGVPIDSIVLNVVLSTGVGADKIDAVEEVLSEYEDTADIVSFNTAIKGYAYRNDTDSARSVVVRLRKRGLRPNAITFNTVMDAAVRSARYEDAWQLLGEMREARIAPDKFTCSILIKGLVKSGVDSGSIVFAQHVRVALELVQEVGPTCDVVLAESLHHSVLEAAVRIPDSTLVMQALAQMRSSSITPNDAALARVRELVRCNSLLPSTEAAATAAATAAAKASKQWQAW
jgi:pentatricopeptide repeat protein